MSVYKLISDLDLWEVNWPAPTDHVLEDVSILGELL